jgi:hypothetical protein
VVVGHGVEETGEFLLESLDLEDLELSRPRDGALRRSVSRRRQRPVSTEHVRKQS